MRHYFFTSQSSRMKYRQLIFKLSIFLYNLKINSNISVFNIINRKKHRTVRTLSIHMFHCNQQVSRKYYIALDCRWNKYKTHSSMKIQSTKNDKDHLEHHSQMYCKCNPSSLVHLDHKVPYRLGNLKNNHPLGSRLYMEQFLLNT